MSRKILVPSGMIKSAALEGKKADVAASTAEAKKFLEKNLAVKFEPGTGVVYDENLGFMVMTHTESELDRTEETMRILGFDGGMGEQASEALFKKLTSIRININFQEISMKNAIKYLMEWSKGADPEKEGIPIEISFADRPSLSETKVTLQLDSVFMLEAIERLTAISNAEYVISPYHHNVVIFEKESNDKIWKTRKISVSDGLIKSVGTPNDSAKKFLEEKFGIKWEFGASVYYIEDRNYMVVTHIESNLNRIEEFMKSKKK